MTDFPNDNHVFPVRVDENPGRSIFEEPVRVPAAAPYRTWLFEKPRAGDPVTAKLQGSAEPRARVPWGSPLLPGQFAMRERDGALEFHPNDQSAVVLFNYVGTGTVVGARIINEIQDELAAMEAYLLTPGLVGNLYHAGASIANRLAKFTNTDGKSISVSPVTEVAGSLSGLQNVAAAGVVSSAVGCVLDKAQYTAWAGNGWNRIATTIFQDEANVQGLIEIAYKSPAGKGRLLLVASSMRNNKAALHLLSHVYTTTGILTAVRVIRPFDIDGNAFLEIYIPNVAGVTVDVTLIAGTYFGAGDDARWTFMVPAVAGSESGQAYEFDVNGVYTGWNFNNLKVSYSSTGVITTNNGAGTGIQLGSNSITPNTAANSQLGSAALPFGPIYAMLFNTLGGKIVTVNPVTGELQQNSGDQAEGTVTFVDSTVNPCTLTFQNGILIEMIGGESLP